LLPSVVVPTTIVLVGVSFQLTQTSIYVNSLLQQEQEEQRIVLDRCVRMGYPFWCVWEIFSSTSRSSVVTFAKLMVKTEALKQVMKLGFVNLAKKVSLTWVSRLTKDESH
jgi:hypothetical protein